MAFKPDSLPTLIGSLPLKDHQEATALVMEYVPEIPLWVQLPCYPEERLLSQFAEGLPGIRGTGDDLHFDTASASFQEELLGFFEAYLEVSEGGGRISGPPFGFSQKTGRGLQALLEAVDKTGGQAALKGQVTGPFTMLTGLKDQDGKAAFFNPELREAVVKALSLKASYQAGVMKERNPNVMIFLDEPALSGFGSSAMVGMPRDQVLDLLTEVMDAVRQAGALAGVHVCANTDWSLILESPVDVISFDAYGYFDRMALYAQRLIEFMKGGGIVAWGLVPTLNEDDLRKEDVDSLLDRWEAVVKALGASRELVKARGLITPSCGTGLLGLELAQKALGLTRDLSRAIRS